MPTSSAQIEIAIEHGIPLSQAHTVNVKKAHAYLESQRLKVDQFLDRLDRERNERAVEELPIHFRPQPESLLPLYGMSLEDHRYRR